MKREYVLLYFLCAVLIVTGSFLLPWVEKAEYERGKRDGIAECEKNCAMSTPAAASLDLGPCSSEQEGTRTGGGSDGSAFQYYCNGSKWIVAREFNIMAYPKPIRKPAPKPKPCDPCEGIKGLREEMDKRFSSLEDVMRSKADPEAGTTGAVMVDKDGNLTLVPGVPHPTFDNSAIGGPCITCSYFDVDALGNSTVVAPPTEPTKIAPAIPSNGPGALLLYAPSPGLHVDSHTTATPEPRTLLLAAGGLGFIAWRMNR